MSLFPHLQNLLKYLPLSWGESGGDLDLSTIVFQTPGRDLTQPTLRKGGDSEQNRGPVGPPVWSGAPLPGGTGPVQRGWCWPAGMEEAAGSSGAQGLQEGGLSPGLRRAPSARSLWKEQYPPQVQRLLQEVQQLKPQVAIDGDWYAVDQDCRRWWKS